MSILESEVALKGGVLRFNDEAKRVATRVKGRIINSVPSPKRRQELRPWKDKVALAIRDVRGRAPWDAEDRYAVTLQFRFRHRPNQKLDVDNYVKPVLDGLAAGLFLREDINPSDRRDLPTYAAHHGVDDSNFRILLIRRLTDLHDGKESEDEEVHLFVSNTERVQEPDASPADGLRPARGR